MNEALWTTKYLYDWTALLPGGGRYAKDSFDPGGRSSRRRCGSGPFRDHRLRLGADRCDPSRPSDRRPTLPPRLRHGLGARRFPRESETPVDGTAGPYLGRFPRSSASSGAWIPSIPRPKFRGRPTPVAKSAATSSRFERIDGHERSTPIPLRLRSSAQSPVSDLRISAQAGFTRTPEVDLLRPRTNRGQNSLSLWQVALVRSPLRCFRCRFDGQNTRGHPTRF